MLHRPHYRKEAKPMSEVKTQDIKLQTETREAIEFIELLKAFTYNMHKGVLIK